MSHLRVKVQYNVIGDYASTEKRTLFVHHNYSSDCTTFFDQDGTHLFTSHEWDGPSLSDAIDLLLAPQERNDAGALILKEGVSYWEKEDDELIKKNGFSGPPDSKKTKTHSLRLLVDTFEGIEPTTAWVDFILANAQAWFGQSGNEAVMRSEIDTHYTRVDFLSHGCRIWSDGYYKIEPGDGFIITVPETCRVMQLSDLYHWWVKQQTEATQP